MSVAVLLTGIMSGCGKREPEYQPLPRDLPPRQAIIPDPAPRPKIQPREDLGSIAQKWRGAAIENETRLAVGARNYDTLAAEFGSPIPQPNDPASLSAP